MIWCRKVMEHVNKQDNIKTSKFYTNGVYLIDRSCTQSMCVGRSMPKLNLKTVIYFRNHLLNTNNDTLCLGREWKWTQQCRDKAYLRILRMFEDRRTAPYSIHQIALMGASEGKQVGEWFGPNTVAQVLRLVFIQNLANFSLQNLLIYFFRWRSSRNALIQKLHQYRKKQVLLL